jgi:hypothetical protein
LPTVYALRGNRKKKKRKQKENDCPNNTEKDQKFPTHDKITKIDRFLQEGCRNGARQA